MSLLYYSKKSIVLFALLFFQNAFSQSPDQVSVLIITCKTGVLSIDGTTIGPLEQDDAKKQLLSIGDHYILLKAPDGNISKTININKEFTGFIKLGCREEIKQEPIRILEKEVVLSGPLSNQKENSLFALDQNDKLRISCTILNKRGAASFVLYSYETNQEIFKKLVFASLDSEVIQIPKKGIYYYSLYTDALLGKSARITIDRIPSPTSNPSFITTPRIKSDTAFKEILKTQTRVYSVTNLDHSNKASISIPLPTNTSYWAFWIGVGDEARENMASFTKSISSAGSLISTNPLVLLGLKLIPSLPMLNAPSSVSYKFSDSQNAQLFVRRQPYNYYKFKHADNITTDYAIVNGYIQDLVLNLENTNTVNGENVEIRVVSFTVTHKYEIDE